MLSAENLASIESDGRRLGYAVREDPQRPVAQYPSWTLGDLAAHTAAIHGRTTLLCRDLPQERISAPRLPEGMDPVDWYEENLDQLLAALTEADPTVPVWGFGAVTTIGFWERRMVVETGVHRWDAEQASGRAEKLTDHVARSGLDELPDLWLLSMGDVQTLKLEATDLGQTWVYGDGKAQETVLGTASDLYLRLASRPSPVRLPDDWAAAVAALPPPKR